MKRNQTKVLGLVIVASLSFSGCSMLSSILPMLGGLLGGGGMGLTDGPENSLFMTSNESGASKLPIQIQTSNKILENPDGGKLYGYYQAQ